jgi:hypothetical protein
VNFVDDRTLPLCISCGDALPPELDLDDATGLACDSCFRESEAKAAAATERMRADEFQYQSREHFMRLDEERLPMMRNQFGRI